MQLVELPLADNASVHMCRQLQDSGGSHNTAVAQLQRERDAARGEAESAKGQLRQRDELLQVMIW